MTDDITTEMLQDYFLAGIIHTLKSIKELQNNNTESLDTIDFDYLITRRMRDMIDTNVLNNINSTENRDYE
jgi:hypothetical protein